MRMAKTNDRMIVRWELFMASSRIAAAAAVPPMLTAKVKISDSAVSTRLLKPARSIIRSYRSFAKIQQKGATCAAVIIVVKRRGLPGIASKIAFTTGVVSHSHAARRIAQMIDQITRCTTAQRRPMPILQSSLLIAHFTH